VGETLGNRCGSFEGDLVEGRLVHGRRVGRLVVQIEGFDVDFEVGEILLDLKVGEILLYSIDGLEWYLEEGRRVHGRRVGCKA
jgi:hypothetical protein